MVSRVWNMVSANASVTIATGGDGAVSRSSKSWPALNLVSSVLQDDEDAAEAETLAGIRRAAAARLHRRPRALACRAHGRRQSKQQTGQRCQSDGEGEHAPVRPQIEDKP